MIGKLTIVGFSSILIFEYITLIIYYDEKCAPASVPIICIKKALERLKEGFDQNTGEVSVYKINKKKPPVLLWNKEYRQTVDFSSFFDKKGIFVILFKFWTNLEDFLSIQKVFFKKVPS